MRVRKHNGVLGTKSPARLLAALVARLLGKVSSWGFKYRYMYTTVMRTTVTADSRLIPRVLIVNSTIWTGDD